MDTPSRLSMDEYINWMFVNQWYDIDIETGDVVNLRNGKLLSPFPKTQGYKVVNLVFNRRCVRQAKIHRMIAIKKYGLDAVKDKHIAHLDGQKTNNHHTNLRPLSPDEHIRYDGTDRNLVHGKEKSSWLPCVECGDPNGSAIATTPDRISGKRFNIDGDICRKCYGKYQERERRKRIRDAKPKICHCDIIAVHLET